jgi:hypothetical protein
MAKMSPKSKPATSEPKTRQGQRQTSFKKTMIVHRDNAGEAPHEQEQGESKRRPGARDVRRNRSTVRGRNRQQEKKGKVAAAAAAPADRSTGHITKPKGSGKAKRRPRSGKSARAGSRRSRSSSTRKETRSSATAP